MKLKKSLVPLILMAMFSVNVVASAESPLDEAFNDVDEEHANFEAIDYLKAEAIVQGYDDGSFKAGNKINRAEFLKIVMEASGVEMNEASSCYKDVKKDAWYAAYICTATKKGFVQGYADGKFRPEQEINFAEASKIIVNGLGIKVDESENETWYEQYVKALQDNSAIPDSIPAFDHFMNRGEMAEVIWRIKANPDYVDSITYHTIKERQLAAETGGELQTFESCVELKEHLENNNQAQERMYKTMTLDAMEGDDGAEAVEESSPSPAPGDEGAGEDSSVDYSTTNVQVEGVDEADIVKTDGKYVYLVKESTVRVVQAYPVEEMKELSRVTFDDANFYPNDMFVDGERLVVIGNSYDSIYPGPMPVEDGAVSSKMIVPDYYSTGLTKVFVFDLKDKNNISVLRELSFEGNYDSSRKVDDMVYVVVNKPEYRYYIMEDEIKENEILPLYSDSVTEEVAPIAPCDQIRYFPGVENTNYMVVAGIPINDPQAQISEEVVLGSSGNIYASRENLYVAEEKYPWFYYGEGEVKEETVIHKFNLGRTDIKYFGKGQVPGHILNQFSMDEYQGNFRIATTVGDVWNTENLSQNNLYVLNQDLKEVGSLTGIAPGEKIYSVRFMGGKAYMVTFKKIDPFFVLDVSEPTNPKVLGKLKIPGYSDYLHPYDENHIIGFGKEAVDASTDETEMRDLDFAWYQGMKVAMFDVTDVSNPVELHKIVIGDRGTESELLYNHKALLFDKEKGLMAFPVSLAELPESVKNDSSVPSNSYGDHVYQGAYVYNVSVENGFQLKGRITHYTDNEVEDLSGYYWYGDKDINRILYIGDYLYTVSRGMVKANGLEDLADVKSVELAK